MRVEAAAGCADVHRPASCLAVRVGVDELGLDGGGHAGGVRVGALARVRRLLSRTCRQLDADLGARVRPDVDGLLVQLRRRRFVVDGHTDALLRGEPVPEVKLR